MMNFHRKRSIIPFKMLDSRPFRLGIFIRIIQADSSKKATLFVRSLQNWK